LTRFQRAAKGAGQSASGGSHDVIEGRGLGFVNLGINTVMFSDFRMDPKKDRVLFLRQVGPSQGAFDPLDAYL
jgi:hypothetical protein